MNKNRLLAAMALHGDSQKTLGKAIGLSEKAVTWRMKGRTEWKLSEIEKISSLYKLSAQDIFDIFFAPSVA